MRRCCVGAGFFVVGAGRSRVGAGSLCWRRLFFLAAAALSFVVARRRRQRFGLPNGLGPPTTLYLPEPAH